MIAFDAAADGGGSTSWSHTCSGANRLLLVGVVGDSGGADNVTGVTYNGVAMTQLKKIQTPTNRFVYIYGLLNPSAGANTVAVGGSAVNSSGSSASYTGVLQSGLPDNSTSTTASGATSLATSLTTVADNCWTVLHVHVDSGNPAAGTGTTNRQISASVGSLLGDSNGVVHPAGSNSMTITCSSSHIGAVMVSFAPSVPVSGQMFSVF